MYQFFNNNKAQMISFQTHFIGMKMKTSNATSGKIPNTIKNLNEIPLAF